MTSLLLEGSGDTSRPHSGGSIRLLIASRGTLEHDKESMFDMMHQHKLHHHNKHGNTFRAA